jgi:hypothetical protein
MLTHIVSKPTNAPELFGWLASLGKWPSNLCSFRRRLRTPLRKKSLMPVLTSVLKPPFHPSFPQIKPQNRPPFLVRISAWKKPTCPPPHPPLHHLLRTPLVTSTLTSLGAASKVQLSINQFLFTDCPNPSAQLPVYTRTVEASFKDPQVTFPESRRQQIRRLRRPCCPDTPKRRFANAHW